MGRVHIQDNGGDREISSRWDGTLELQLRDEDQIEIVVPDEAPYTADDIVITGSQAGGGSGYLGAAPTWLLYVPTFLGICALLVDELDLLGGLGAIGGVLVVGLYWIYVLHAIVGTITLYSDAQELPVDGWLSNPWLYIVGGGAGFTLLSTVLWELPSTWQAIAASLAGAFIVGSVIASSITGPIYLFVRRRVLDS